MQQVVENKTAEMLQLCHQKLQNNKKQMLKIMKESPIAGVYRNEDPNQWDNFFQFYMKFLKSQIGPRGQCSKAVRLQMSQNPQLYDQVLSLLKMSHKSHIRDIYVRYKTYSPCPQYDEIIKVKQHLQKNEDSFKNIMDENSIMYNKIKAGMLEKRGQEYDYKSEIELIRQKYIEKLANLKETICNLQEKLDHNDNYLKYMKVKEVMKKFFTMWKQADVKVGFESIEKGDSFEKNVQDKLLPYILEKSKISADQKYQFLTNCRWFPKNLGQIDIAIATYDANDQKWEIKVLIQCKSRLFDIREAYKQVAVLKQKGKQKLCTKLGILDIATDPLHFIVTTLPENPFHLPIESKMKQALQRASKNIPIDELKSQNMYPLVKQVFKDELSPLQWFINNDSDRIIVMKY